MRMFLLLFLFLISICAAYDLRRWQLQGRRMTLRIIVLLLLDVWPLLTTLLGLLIDNTPSTMHLFMWSTWGWLLYIATRLILLTASALGVRLLGIIATAAVAGLFLWGAFVGRKALRVTEVEICSDRLPAAFDGLRIAHISDLHLGTLVDLEGEVGALIEQINAAKPNLVCFTGDLVSIRYSELDSAAMQLLQQIEAPVYSVLGNHDVGPYIRKQRRLSPEESTRQLVARQKAMGWQVIENSTNYLVRGSDSISLTGLAYDPTHWKQRHKADLPFMGGKEAYSGVDNRLYNLTLVHVPQLWKEVLARGFGDLTLSGHTHAMQLKIPLGEGRSWSPAAWIYEHWSGRYDLNNHTLYVNDGIGYVGYPMRIGAAPELTLITLKSCK